MYQDTWPLSTRDNGANQPHVPFSEALRPTAFVADGIIAAFSELRRAVATGVGYCHRRWQIYRTETALLQLDDRTLRDIGIEHCQISAVARTVVENPSVDPRPAVK